MDDLSWEDVFERILPCIEAHAAGRNDVTRQRREAIVMFFHAAACSVYQVELPPARRLDWLSAELEHFTLALERIDSSPGDDPELAQQVRAAVEGTWTLLLRAADLAVPHLELGEQEQATRIAWQALTEVFDWTTPAHLRAYVYVMTGEMLRDGLLGNERHQFETAIRQCLEQINHE